MSQKNIVSLIAAIGKNRELGKGNQLLFKIPEDMRFFREKTSGHPVIMGRKTWESIGRALPNRLNIVVSREAKSEFGFDNVVGATSIEEAIEKAKNAFGSDEIFVIGGAQMYQQAIQFADKIYLTVVDAHDLSADVFFPDYSEFKTVVFRRESSDENYSYTFLDLRK